MKFGFRLFLFLAAFYLIVDLVYWYMGGEPVGIVAIGLSAGLAIIIGYYFWFINRRTGGVLPEDNLDADIADGAGELGFFSPHSWWPALLISILGFVLEYERPSATSHH
ncbi:MAG: cytochrome c oxidase subunit 4 [Actinobacteria bacterium]|nr:cytochrome c oxidase subunit 4 [Actinomycetota bacterium]